MKTIRIFVSFLFAFTTSTALPENVNKVVTQIAGSNLCWGLNYSEEGLITDVIDKSEKGPELLWSYDYNYSREGSHYILQYGYYNADNVLYEDSPFYRSSTLNSDNLISKDKNGNSFMWSTGEDFEYEYESGRLVKMTGEYGMVVELSWVEGNLTQMVFLEGDKEEGRISCSYTDIPAKGICQAFNSPLMLLLDYYTMQSLGPLAHGYYGMLSQNLLSEITISFTKEFAEKHSSKKSYGGYYPITEKKSRKYSYESDTEGNISRIVANEEGKDLVYELNYGYTEKKCASPTIVYDRGVLSFNCETQYANYFYNIKCLDAHQGYLNYWERNIGLTQMYKIRVQAILDGYQDSDMTEATIGWRNGQPVMEGFSSVTMETPTNLPPLGEANADVNGDGKVDVADIATIISVMAGQPSE